MGHRSKQAKLSHEEAEFFHQVDEQVDEKVHGKIRKQHKHGHQKIDEKAIEEECAQEVFQELQKPVTEMIHTGEQFFKQLKHDDPHLYVEFGHELEVKGVDLQKVTDFDAFVEYWNQHQIDPKMLYKIYQIGERHYVSREFEKAHLYFTWLCAADAKSPQMWFVKGIVEQSMKKFGDAVASFCQVITLDPTIVNVYTQLMNCLILMGELEAARQVFDIFSKEIDPKDYKNDNFITNNVNSIKEILF